MNNALATQSFGMAGAGYGSTLPNRADYIRQGLIQRGLPEHVATAFVMNGQDESGLDPSINERAPIVPGSRGGFGIMQWTGPRRVALERAAAETGKPVDDLDLQMDYLVSELQGPEARAAQSILSARDEREAAAAIARDFLRPAKEHLDRRVAKYTGGKYESEGNNALATYGQPQQPAMDQNALAAILADAEAKRKPDLPQLWAGHDPAMFMNRNTFG